MMEASALDWLQIMIVTLSNQGMALGLWVETRTPQLSRRTTLICPPPASIDLYQVPWWPEYVGSLTRPAYAIAHDHLIISKNQSSPPLSGECVVLEGNWGDSSNDFAIALWALIGSISSLAFLGVCCLFCLLNRPKKVRVLRMMSPTLPLAAA